jgi:hypothetical protein
MRRLFVLLAAVVILSAPWTSQQPAAQGAVDIFASPIQAGCYLARGNQCKIHVDPFTINIAPGKKLVSFQLLSGRTGGVSGIIYDFRTDQSNPVPFTGSTYSPSLVAKDFAASCSATYSVFLEGQDSSSPTTFNLGSTNTFKCPTGTFIVNLPFVGK